MYIFNKIDNFTIIGKVTFNNKIINVTNIGCKSIAIIKYNLSFIF